MMRSPLWLLTALMVSGVLPCSAQIFADFTVSHGGSPLGTFTARLDFDKAPRTCANFIGLATGEKAWIDETTGEIQQDTPFYDGLTFHRLIHNFMIQGGSPNGQGTDGPGYTIQDEFHPDLRHSGRYMLSMANTGQVNTGGAQFFITLVATGWLDDRHSVFGEVISGKTIIDGFTNSGNFPTGTADKPLTDIVMDSVVIYGPDLAGFDIDDPALELTRVSPVPGNLSVVPGGAVTYTPASQLAGGQWISVFRTEDLANWTRATTPLVGYDDPQASAQVDTATVGQAFYRLARIEHVGSKTPSSLASRTLFFDTTNPGETLIYEMDGTGQGGTCVYNGGAPQPINELYYYPKIYGADLIVVSQGFFPLKYEMWFDGETPSDITGSFTLYVWSEGTNGNPGGWQYYAPGTLEWDK